MQVRRFVFPASCLASTENNSAKNVNFMFYNEMAIFLSVFCFFAGTKSPCHT